MVGGLSGCRSMKQGHDGVVRENEQHGQKKEKSVKVKPEIPSL